MSVFNATRMARQASKAWRISKYLASGLTMPPQASLAYQVQPISTVRSSSCTSRYRVLPITRSSSRRTTTKGYSRPCDSACIAFSSQRSMVSAVRGRAGIQVQIASSRPASSSAGPCEGRIGSSRMWLPVSVIGPIGAKSLEGLRDHEEDDDDEQQPGDQLDGHRRCRNRGRRLPRRAARAPQVGRQKGAIQAGGRHVEKEAEQEPARKE